MKTPSLNTIAMTMLGAVILFGGALYSQTSSPPATAPTLLPTDPKISAYVAEVRAELSDGKTQLIGGVMNLSNEEARKFWPIYEEYESELFDLGDQRIDLIRRFAAAQKSGKLEQRDASELAEEYFKFEQQQLDLQKKYHGIIAKELSPVRAAQFAQIEHRVGTVIDLAIAAELPLIQSSPDAKSP